MDLWIVGSGLYVTALLATLVPVVRALRWKVPLDPDRRSSRALLERANLGRLRLQHWEAEAPNAIMGWTVFQPRREQWTR